MTTKNTTATLHLDPLDGLFFRDGRPFGPGNAANSGLPMPQTLAGALRSHLMARLGCDFDALGQALKRGETLADALADQSDDLAVIAALRLSGPWLYRDNSKTGPHGVMWPVPAILHQEKTEDGDGPLHLLRPLKVAPPGWDVSDAPTERALWADTARTTEPVKGFISTDGMSDILSGKAPAQETLVKPRDLYEHDRRVGLVVGAQTNTAEDGMLYTAGFLRLAPGVRFVAELAGLTEALRKELDQGPVLSWGGERRRVRVSLGDEALAPSHDPGSADGACLILTTPAPLAHGWHGADWKPIAAAVPDAVVVSGWDLARRRPKPTRFAAPAGSVFFFDGPAPDALAGGVCDDEDRRLGYGCVLTGVWK